MNSMKKNTRALLSRTWPLGLALAAVFILSGKSALAASAQEIDSNVTAALQTLYANTPERKIWETRQEGFWFSRISSREASFSPRNMAMAPCAKEGRTVATIDRWRAHLAFRPGFSPLDTSCFLWTTHRFNISTTVTAGNWEPGQPLLSWTKASARIFPQRRFRVVFTLSSSTRRG
jgi:hypothetical protein